jgi:hypothetical protein
MYTWYVYIYLVRFAHHFCVITCVEGMEDPDVRAIFEKYPQRPVAFGVFKTQFGTKLADCRPASAGKHISNTLATR